MNERVRRSIGRLLRRLRAERGVSLIKLEELTGKLGSRVPRSRLSMLERGEVGVQLDDVQVLCRVYGMELADLVLEALAAKNDGRFSAEMTPTDLCERAERLLDDGRALDAGWAFDEANLRAGLEDRGSSARALLGASIAYQRAGISLLAIRRIERALDVLDAFDGGSKAYTQCLARYGFLLSEVGAFNRAFDQIQLASSRVKGAHDMSLRAFVGGNEALVLFAAGRYSEALSVARETARRYQRCGSPSMSSRQLALAARCELKLGDAARAIRVARDSVALAEEAGQKDSHIWSLIVMAEILFEAGRHEEADESARRASELLAGSGLEPWKVRAYTLLEAIARAARRSHDVTRWRRERHRLDPMYGMPSLPHEKKEGRPS